MGGWVQGPGFIRMGIRREEEKKKKFWWKKVQGCNLSLRVPDQELLRRFSSDLQGPRLMGLERWTWKEGACQCTA